MTISKAYALLEAEFEPHTAMRPEPTVRRAVLIYKNDTEQLPDDACALLDPAITA